MRRLRIVAPVQLPLDLPGVVMPTADRWLLLPDATRAQVLGLLARLIARGLVEGTQEEGSDACC